MSRERRIADTAFPSYPGFTRLVFIPLEGRLDSDIQQPLKRKEAPPEEKELLSVRDNKVSENLLRQPEARYGYVGLRGGAWARRQETPDPKRV